MIAGPKSRSGTAEQGASLVPIQSSSMSEAAKTQKGERTRQVILDVALRLFQERGYDKTSMRLIAKEAGVAVGNAYYYFASKEHLVQGFYSRLHRDHRTAVDEALAGDKSFKSRLRKMLIAKIDVAAPYHDFAGILFRTAADPKSPLNPFSPESKEVRDQATVIAREVLEKSSQKAPKGLEDELPQLIWLYEMAIVLFWIHDHSEGSRRTYKLIDRTSEIVARIVGLLANPLLAPIRRATKKLLVELRQPAA